MLSNGSHGFVFDQRLAFRDICKISSFSRPESCWTMHMIRGGWRGSNSDAGDVDVTASGRRTFDDAEP